MFICLLIGVTLAVTMITSIPIYTRGNLQKTLTKDMDSFGKKQGVYPGSLNIDNKAPVLNKDTRRTYFEKFAKESKGLDKKINIPILSKKIIYTTSGLNLSEDGKKYSSNEKYKLEAVNDFEKHINITQGKIYSEKKSSDGFYEVIVSNSTFKDLTLKLDTIYYVYKDKQEEMLKIKVVGVYEPKNEKENFWIEGKWKFNEIRFLMNYNLCTSTFMDSEKVSADTAQIDYIVDYKKIKIDNFKIFNDNINKYVSEWSDDMDIDLSAPVTNMLNIYSEKQKSIQSTLLVLETPIFIILILYASMVAKLIVEEEKNEIAVLQSRGVNRGKILFTYFMESIIVSLIAMSIGPPLGMGVCKFMGITSGFLDFSNRKAIYTSLILKDYLYSLVGIAVFIITMMIPVFFASRKNIIMRKSDKTGRNKKAVWQKYYLDVIMLAVSIYGLKNYNLRQKLLGASNVKPGEIPVDPSIYIITTLFILSVGLIFLRIYPYIVRFIFKIGKKIWSPSVYASLINVGRSDGKNQFIMIFIILTIAIGIFDIKCARTMNSSIENKTRYIAGADVVMQGHWKEIKADSKSTKDIKPDKVDKPDKSVNADTKQEDFAKPVFFEEPPYSIYSHLAGIKETTKVFTNKNANFKFKSDKENSKIHLMGIITNEFGKVAWFDPSLMENHWYEYLNLMAKNPKAVLMSRNCANDYGIKLGDRINVSWTVTGDNPEKSIAKNGPIELVVYGFVDYWPSYNPKDIDANHLIVANLQYLQGKLPMDKYEMWIRKDPEKSTKLLYDDIKNKKLMLDSFYDTSRIVSDNLYNAGAQNVNAAFNLCFIAIIIVTALAFLIYWTLSIKSRVLQFGILRAMGMSLKKIINMLFCEQILISVVSMIIGALIGSVTCKIFLPLLNLVTSSSEQIIPLRLISFQGDIMKLGFILALIFIMVIIILGIYVSKIKMDQAVKLGED